MPGARKRPSFCAAWAYGFSPLQMDQMSTLRISAPLMSSVPPGGGQGWETEAHEGVAKLAFI